MKRVAVILGLAAVVPAPAALAQIPPPSQPAPSAPAGPAPATSEAAPSSEVAAPPPPPPPAAPPGDQYYVEKPGAAPPAPAPAPFEPPLPGGTPYEPPPPPKVSHLAPRSSLWLGARLGWFVPFGNLWARGVATGPDQGRYYYVLEGTPWSDYASSGPVLEIDAGVRLSRSYSAFLLWERAQLGSGEDERGRDGAQDGGETDFWAIGLRANSDPDRLGFVTEVAIGYRRARTFFENEVEYQFTDAPFEARLGLGAEYRLSRLTTLSALAAVGVGGFGSAERVDADGRGSSLTGPFDEGDGHGWVTLTVGAHFDLLGSKN
ncbi:MAG TPA: hypothetical protein VEX18_16115 [Polyangiaceae bacterium]|nr:hypothetical protein [Polyangiaceae bacterium]